MSAAITKARRPSWVDTPIRRDQSELIGYFELTERYQGVLSRILLRLFRSIIDADTMRRIGVVLRRPNSTIGEVLNEIAFFSGGTDASQAIWWSFRQSIEDLYVKVMTETGQAEFDKQKWKMRFTVLPDQVIQKQEVPIVPPNPFSLRWIENSSFALLSGLSLDQQQMLQRVLFDAYELGLRPEAIEDKIAEVIGLSPNQADRLLRREALQRTKGIAAEKIAADSAKFSAQMLKERVELIARTEMITAQNQGLQDSWMVAQDSGELEQHILREWVEVAGSPRTCPTCLGLGGQQVPLDKPFYSGIKGEVSKPPAHPRCRCTMVLVFSEPELQLDAALQDDLERIRRENLASR